MNKSLWTDKIKAWIEEHRAEMVEDIVRLVRIKSVSDKTTDVKPYGQGCKDALDTMLEMAQGYGFQVHNFEDYFGRIGLGNGDGPTISLWGHLDVVPEGEDWDYPPYEGVVKEGLIIGRGSQDNKGQVVATLFVMRCIRDLGIPLDHNLELYVGTDEEQGMTDLDYYLSRYPEPDFNIIPDSNFPVCYGEKGGVTLTVRADAPLSDDIVAFSGGTASNVVPGKSFATIRQSERVRKAMPYLKTILQVEEEDEVVHLTASGKAGHTAFPENSVNAIYVLTRALTESGALNEPDSRLFSLLNRVNEDCFGIGLGIAREDNHSGPLTCVGSIAGIRDGRLEVTLNVRYPITLLAQPIVEDIERTARSYGFTIESVKDNPAHYFPENHPVVERLMNVYNDVMGESKEAYVLPGGTYCRKFKNAISFGMGFGKNTERYLQPYRHLLRDGHGHAHGPDECTLIELLEKAILIYVLGLLAIDDLSYAPTE
ncbi:Sapep family Mn(2+)-dependent dipeptidase [Cohnella sp. WQ 127256]|uniref:Sapep family Mn(2+)-dependent dipeptidase n=1 Tax=Cohnella sp. WQ 127256 TaxID=2938790 RepID=UPI002118DFE5|nr:Sapep family Mn(2+)-dependent dipeptidase [Cohnella sp. WQ 127256]